MSITILFGVQSGSGYFVRWEKESPLMESDPVCAARMQLEECRVIVEKLEGMGFSAEIFQINKVSL